MLVLERAVADDDKNRGTPQSKNNWTRPKVVKAGKYLHPALDAVYTHEG